jgi:hypothetical protein
MLRHRLALSISVCTLVLMLFNPGFSQDNETDPVQTEAAKILKNILTGLSEGDYVLFSQNFSGMLLESLDRESFLKLQKNVQKSLGKIQSVNYLGFYKQYGNVITLFKAKFSKDKDDVLIKLVLESNGINPKVTGVWLDTPAIETK